MLQAVVLGFASLSAGAGTVSVYVSDQCARGVGADVVYALREEIRRSAGYKLALEASTAPFSASIVCLNDSDAPDDVGVYSFIFTMRNKKGPWSYYLHSAVATCGSKRVDECARALMSDIDSTVTDARELLELLSKPRAADG